MHRYFSPINIILLIRFKSKPVPISLINCYLSLRAKRDSANLVIGESPISRATVDFHEAIGDTFDVHWVTFLLELVYPNQHLGGFFFHTPEILLSCAKELDTSLNYDLSRWKLYNCVPYRPKIRKSIMPINDQTRAQIHPQIPMPIQSINCEWTKQQLIDKLEICGVAQNV